VCLSLSNEGIESQGRAKILFSVLTFSGQVFFFPCSLTYPPSKKGGGGRERLRIYKCLDMPAMEVEKRSAPLDMAVETIAVVAFEAVLTS